MRWRIHLSQQDFFIFLRPVVRVLSPPLILVVWFFGNQSLVGRIVKMNMATLKCVQKIKTFCRLLHIFSLPQSVEDHQILTDNHLFAAIVSCCPLILSITTQLDEIIAKYFYLFCATELILKRRFRCNTIHLFNAPPILAPRKRDRSSSRCCVTRAINWGRSDSFRVCPPELPNIIRHTIASSGFTSISLSLAVTGEDHRGKKLILSKGSSEGRMDNAWWHWKPRFLFIICWHNKVLIKSVGNFWDFSLYKKTLFISLIRLIIPRMIMINDRRSPPPGVMVHLKAASDGRNGSSPAVVQHLFHDHEKKKPFLITCAPWGDSDTQFKKYIANRNTTESYCRFYFIPAVLWPNFYNNKMHLGIPETPPEAKLLMWSPPLFEPPPWHFRRPK